MPTTYLEFTASASYGLQAPTLEIIQDGNVIASFLFSSETLHGDLWLSYAGDAPDSLSFRFNDGLTEAGREIDLSKIKIGGYNLQHIGLFDQTSLLDGEEATLSIADALPYFNQTPLEASDLPNDALIFTEQADDFYRFNSEEDFTLSLLAGRDAVYLGSGMDTVVAGDGNDIVRSGAGEDILSGNNGDDRLIGEEGNDTIYGGAGFDLLFGDEGDDIIYGGDDDDRVVGNEGHDILFGGNGNDRVNGGTGDDRMYGDAGDDILVSAAGNDILEGGDGNDNLRAGAGDDYLYSGAGDDLLYGNNGNDNLYAEEGMNILYGGNDNDHLEDWHGTSILFGESGADTLYGGSKESLGTLVDMVLSSNPDVSYNEQTNSFYRFVSTAEDWADASAIASNSSLINLAGVSGHLVNSTSAEENVYITTLANGNSSWIGASQQGSLGDWWWANGPEDGMVFWSGGLNGAAVNGAYENWLGGDPGTLAFLSNFGAMNANGKWEDSIDGSARGYVIEWDASSLRNGLNATTLNGGTGQDDLYGSAQGADLFVVADADAADRIFDFDLLDGDRLDISDLIDYTAGSDDISQFVSFAEDNGDTVVSVDSDGAENGTLFADVARIMDTTGLDLQALAIGGGLIVE